MSREFFEIRHETLLSAMREAKMSQAKVATCLGLSVKTVQRWVNRTSKHIRKEHLESLGKILGVNPDHLVRFDESIQVKPINKALEGLLSDECSQRVRATESWQFYEAMLDAYTNEDLSTCQTFSLKVMLGVSAIHQKKLRSSRKHLEQAIPMAVRMGREDKLTYIYCHLVFCEELAGKRKKAELNLEKAGLYLEFGKVAEDRALFHFTRGRLAYRVQDYALAEGSYRTAIHLCLKNPRQNSTRIAVYYLYLGWVYLRLREFSKAKVIFKRLQRWAKICGWARGIATGKMALAVVELFENPNEYSPTAFGRARKFREYSSVAGFDPRIEQLEFLQKIFLNEFEEAHTFNLHRLLKCRRSRLLVSYVILDGVFLNKISNGRYPMRVSLIEKAMETFKSNQLNRELEIFDVLLGSSKISMADFVKLYIF